MIRIRVEAGDVGPWRRGIVASGVLVGRQILSFIAGRKTVIYESFHIIMGEGKAITLPSCFALSPLIHLRVPSWLWSA
jgi:hypothetical protein